MKNKILLILISTCFLISFRTFAQATWELDKSKDGIKVYTRNKENSDFISFKAVITVDASIDELLKILKNTTSYTKWYGYTKTATLLKREKNIQYNYVETIFPWPFRNRDMVYKMSIFKFNKDSIKISLEGIPNYEQEKKGIVRMKKAEGYISLEHSGNKTEVIYVLHSEPGDNIPAWMANNSIAKLPFKTLSGLRKVLKNKSEVD
jgi:hypothetical protein